MYSSKEYRSKCIRNTVSSLLVLARDVRTSVPCDRMSCCTTKRRVTPSPGELEGPQDFSLVPSALPLSFTNLACQCGFITSSKLSPFPSFGPAANEEVFTTAGRWVRATGVGGQCRSVQGMDAMFASHGVGAEGLWAGGKGGSWPFFLDQGFSVRVYHLVICAVRSQSLSLCILSCAQPYGKAKSWWAYLPCTYLHSYSVLNGSHRYW